MIQEYSTFIQNEAKRFGAIMPDSPKMSFRLRENIGNDALDDNGAYIGLIQPDEEPSGQYYDFSLTINPALDDKPWYVNICVGSLGFKNDYELATRPGMRRLFSQLVDIDGFCKSDFSDIETKLPRELTGREDLQHFTRTIGKYSSLYTAFQILTNPKSEEAKQRVSAFIAAYARLRNWPTNAQHRKAVQDALAPFMISGVRDEFDEVNSLIEERKYVVLQGAPGTGKTRLAMNIAEKLGAESFFTQFHAETTYSDFVFGIRPVADEQNLQYENVRGVFAASIEYAVENSDTPVLLIIDEINRANLSNVLGPAFFLFEHKREESRIRLEVAPGLALSKLPDNMYVIATMNTADRSLAVVDFALRRRFAWYTMNPKRIDSQDFHDEDFLRFKEIFEWYAESNEMSLQPGQGYFLAANDEEMKNRVRYELLPLVREYLSEGLLVQAREEFNDYFLRRIGRQIAE